MASPLYASDRNLKAGPSGRGANNQRDSRSPSQKFNYDVEDRYLISPQTEAADRMLDKLKQYRLELEQQRLTINPDGVFSKVDRAVRSRSPDCVERSMTKKDKSPSEEELEKICCNLDIRRELLKTKLNRVDNMLKEYKKLRTELSLQVTKLERQKLDIQVQSLKANKAYEDTLEALLRHEQDKKLKSREEDILRLLETTEREIEKETNTLRRVRMTLGI